MTPPEHPDTAVLCTLIGQMRAIPVRVVTDPSHSHADSATHS